MQLQFAWESHQEQDYDTGAIIDESGKYRYLLWRQWDKCLPKLTFVMLNPSTADHSLDDPTIRRCISFCKMWGYGTLQVVNLFAFRATDPRDLIDNPAPVGKLNDFYIRKAIINSDGIILAWGTKGGLHNRNRQVLDLLSDVELHCLEFTKEGHPKHPLYVGSWVKPLQFT